MKKIFGLMILLTLLISLCACGAKPASEQKNESSTTTETETKEESKNTEETKTAEESSEGGTIGYLAFLNLSEEEVESRRKAESPAYAYLIEQGILEVDEQKPPHRDSKFYDSLDAMLMGLMSGEVSSLNVPDSTAKYLCTVNDQVKQYILYHPEKAEGFSQDLLNRLCNGYSFMMLEENSELRDQFDQAIKEMKEDGTLDKLTQEYITDAAKNGETQVVEFEKFEGEPIKVAVSGDLAPMDYVAADGTPAGFNTAVLAEIGKRLGKNIELVQVDSTGRALALAQGNVDAVFWTRGFPEAAFEEDFLSMSEEEREAYIQEKKANYTEEEKKIMDDLTESLQEKRFSRRDRPEGTVITAPYYTDLNVLIVKK